MAVPLNARFTVRLVAAIVSRLTTNVPGVGPASDAFAVVEMETAALPVAGGGLVAGGVTPPPSFFTTISSTQPSKPPILNEAVPPPPQLARSPLATLATVCPSNATV